MDVEGPGLGHRGHGPSVVGPRVVSSYDPRPGRAAGAGRGAADRSAVRRERAGALALVALFAGLGEETLFRGVIQPALATHLPVLAALAATAALFGLAHWITPTYALLAGIVGAYLGGLLLVSGNLLVPIVAHALYDLVALTLLVRLKPTLASSVL